MAAPNSTISQTSVDTPDVFVLAVPVMANLANSAVLKLAVPYAFVVSSVLWRQGSKAVTTGAKLATATLQISGTPATGGVVSLTSAACTPAGAVVAGTPVTGLNSGAVGGTVEIAISAVTAFVEGDGWFEVTILPTSAG